jgi:hypothetical protein
MMVGEGGKGIRRTPPFSECGMCEAAHKKQARREASLIRYHHHLPLSHADSPVGGRISEPAVVDGLGSGFEAGFGAQG